ncbi:hypothetical protein E0Z10_g6182 [Xylaria hypoxylon]|uniref:Uncharacterized protein n=1 Tax=Xylaria hypoxylon TaxID=37992 RepID=A0A4Z0Z1S8_9PEZI|nr:hypothetical protein E0Z10_g6182 [Xylaria hypoxylon]
MAHATFLKGSGLASRDSDVDAHAHRAVSTAPWFIHSASRNYDSMKRNKFGKGKVFSPDNSLVPVLFRHQQAPKDDAYAQFTLEGESASSTKIQLSIANRRQRNAPRTTYAPNISVPFTPKIINYSTTPKTADSKPRRIIDNHTADLPSNGHVGTGPAKDKPLPGIEHLRRGPELTDPWRQGRKTPNREKRFGVADPLAWDVINRSLTQQRRLSSLISTGGPVAAPVKQASKKTTDVASRTSSQRRALNRFTRELEKYADAASAAGKLPVITPTISESKASMHTVKPLVPYKDEFLAAGLAVTSAEQTRNLSRKAHAQASVQRSRPPHKHSNGPLQVRKKLDPPGDGASSNASTSNSCTSSGSYVEFSPPDGRILHAIESLVPQKANTKLKYCHHTRKRLLSWLLKKPSSKDGSINGNRLPVQIQHVKGGQIKSDDLSSAQHERHRLQHRSHRPTMQSIPETQLWPKPPVPAKYVTPKKEPCVAVASDYYEHSDQGLHPAQEGGHQHSLIDAKQALDSIGLRGKRDITRGVLPKPYPEPIATIEEETEITTHPVDNGIQGRCSNPTGQKEIPSGTEGTRRRPNAMSSATHESSVPSLPFAARLAAGTASSLQRALDDACQKIDDQDEQADKLPQQEDIMQEPPPIPRRDLRHNVSHCALPRKPSVTEKFIYVKRNMPTVESAQSISKPLPPEPVPATQATPENRSDPNPSQPSRNPPPAPRALTGKRKNAVAELAKAEEMLRDLDVFLNDYDDADIEDRDVIKGLQVAIHAAADDLYDGYIRHKTGLRIRRFLADLKSFEDISELSPRDQRAREKRAKSRKLEGVRDRNNQR